MEREAMVEKDCTQAFEALGLHRPMRLRRYEPGTELVYELTGVACRRKAKATLHLDRFIGGGFAGQVYRVTLLALEGAPLQDLVVGKQYALKLLVPPSGASKLFRDTLYAVGFQGAFQLQVNPYAARAGALWQKFIRRAARLRFGTERVVVDIHATLVDERLGTCGELSEWIEGRTWDLEVDDRMDLLRRWERGWSGEEDRLGSPEYRAKKEFMDRFVALLHELGAHEFARQYTWTTWKSQPNCLKRLREGAGPGEGLTAVDFRAGLALLPCLPMSPGDFGLIFDGLRRGSLVQFDRGDLETLRTFIASRPDEFEDLRDQLKELEQCEQRYREGGLDLTHNLFRLHRASFWTSVLDTSARGWWLEGQLDVSHRERLLASRFRCLGLFLLGLVPFLGILLRKTWGHLGWRRHYQSLLTNCGYLGKALAGKACETVLAWHRAGRINPERASALLARPALVYAQLPLALLPAGLHRMTTEVAYLRDRLSYYFVRPLRLYFDQPLRETWLREMIEAGRAERMLTGEAAERILSQLDDPYIQRYLKSLAVHVCTLPVTQVVSVSLAIGYVLTHPELPAGEAWAIGLGIVALFQVIPVSPGSLTRGLYVVWLVLRERNLKDYTIAMGLSFFKYIGYLAFPIQMGYRYPELAQFMATRWATEAVHIVPVFGERGALLEHTVFCLCYNWPLTLRRRMKRRAELRSRQQHRYWPLAVVGVLGAAGFPLGEALLRRSAGSGVGLREIWALVLFLPLLCGSLTTLAAKGTPLPARIGSAALSGLILAVLSTFSAFVLGWYAQGQAALISGAWRVFLGSFGAIVGALLTEVFLPEPPEGP